LINESLREQILKADHNTNLSSLIPKPAQDTLIFSINDIAFVKDSVDTPVYYRQLSDGEHQMLHVLGTIMLMNMPSTMLLMDEPETHFNPEWRSKFVSILNDIVKAEEISRQQEIILTSHSPFIVSDCRQEKVFIFERDSQTHKIKQLRNPDFVTYGASVNQITAKVFGKVETIAGLASRQMTDIKNEVKDGKKTKEDAINEILKIGDSVEKIITLDEIDKMNN
jgi:restriction system-associated AAA family ATPase